MIFVRKKTKIGNNFLTEKNYYEIKNPPEEKKDNNHSTIIGDFDKIRLEIQDVAQIVARRAGGAEAAGAGPAILT